MSLAEEMRLHDSAFVHCPNGHEWRAEVSLELGGYYFELGDEICPQCGKEAIETE
jgi:hypothetical protein